MSKIAVIAGVGPGLGAAIARKFADEGCNLALLSRSSAYSINLSKRLEDTGISAIPIPTDITDVGQVTDSFAQIRQELGVPDILVNHAGNAAWGNLSELTAEAFENSWRVCTLGAFLCVKQVVPGMIEKGEGTILFSGATSAVRGRSGAIAFSSAKFAMRGLASSLAREVGPQGIHVAHVIIDGIIDSPNLRERYKLSENEPLLKPDAIAETYWALVQQERSAWSFEVDVRPHNEEFFT
ncbi:SDR family NAD(P)-dependent oxidoreductase [Candidatus Poribacteria bacterium]|nr:SDR family NAD(P)-dependent oxidoreductase [Candidatus Poribacteria bacterium]MYI94516.1 SDR family NAD(P)-dependent oxidoreductase [Candidatus Poribacteria bacterium]